MAETFSGIIQVNYERVKVVLVQAVRSSGAIFPLTETLRNKFNRDVQEQPFLPEKERDPSLEGFTTDDPSFSERAQTVGEKSLINEILHQLGLEPFDP